MGTRSLTRIMEEKWEHGRQRYGEYRTICCIYQQYDGHPESVGKELADFLEPFTMRNGYSLGDKPRTHANGMDCLAAQMIAYRKEDIGNVYVKHPDTVDVGEEYIYEVYMKDGDLQLKLIEPGWGEYPTQVLFDGPPSGYAAWLEKYDPEEGE